MQKSINNIAIAGSGNIAWHFAKGLKMQGYEITSIWSREQANAQRLAESVGSSACNHLELIGDEADLIIIAVTDNAIRDVAGQISSFDGIIVHTAGSVALDILSKKFRNSGVLYPLQTFSKNTEVFFEDVPFFIEASSTEVFQAIQEVALKLSPNIFEASSKNRMLLHVAAVFAGNYSNLMYRIGDEILKNSGLPADVLHPLILETARKAVRGDAYKLQTGPARRKDTATLEKHYSALASMPEYADLYLILANAISKKY